MGISRQTVYLLSLAALLLFLVLLFSFLWLIPQGKEYRQMRIEKKQHAMVLSQYRHWHDQTFDALKDLQSKHKNIIGAFESRFDAERFMKMNRGYFESLSMSEAVDMNLSSEFALYELNVTSRIDSPQSFYAFLEALNKSSWIIGVDFPIHFEREGDMVRSNFTMRVYSVDVKE